MNNLVITNMLLAVDNGTSATHVTTTGDHDQVTSVELHHIRDLSLFEIELNGIVRLDVRIRITDSATVMRHDVWHAVRADRKPANFEELVCRLLRCNAVDCETTLDVVQKAEMLARLLNGDNI